MKSKIFMILISIILILAGFIGGIAVTIKAIKIEHIIKGADLKDNGYLITINVFGEWLNYYWEEV